MAELPPGPSLRSLQSLRYLRDPYAFFRACRDRYGDPFTAYTSLPVVVTGRVDGIREIFIAPTEAFKVELPASHKRVLGANGLTSLAGRAHKRQRRLIVPSLQGPSLRALGGMMQDCAVEALARMQPGNVVVMRDKALRIGLDVILKTVFGVEERAEHERFREAVLAFTGSFGSASFLLCAILGLRSGRLPPNARFDAARGRLERMIADVIARRRRSDGDRPDMLSRMIAARYEDGSGMTDEVLTDNLITSLVAGHETSVVTLSWAMYWTHRQADVLDRLLAELAPLGPLPDPDACARLPFLDAVVKETLRLYPAVPEVVRMPAEPFSLQGYTIPVGMNVSASAALVHSDPEIYPEPEAFRPERFLGRKVSPFEFIPFGGGERVCIGNQFSVFEVKILLATLLAGARFDSIDAGPPRIARSGFLMAPKTGVRLIHRGPRAALQ